MHIATFCTLVDFLSPPLTLLAISNVCMGLTCGMGIFMIFSQQDEYVVAASLGGACQILEPR